MNDPDVAGALKIVLISFAVASSVLLAYHLIYHAPKQRDAHGGAPAQSEIEPPVSDRRSERR